MIIKQNCINKINKVLENKINKINEEKNLIIKHNNSINTFKFEDLQNIFNNLNYNNKKSNNKKLDICSLTYLLKDLNLKQNECIKLGLFIEKFLFNLILQYTNLKSIKEKNKKDKIKKDHLFLDDNKKIIYYAEIKSNINLDTEKSKQTINKILNVNKELINQYKNYKIIYYLVNVRFLYKNEIPKNILNKYKQIDNNLCCLNEYLTNLNINYKFNYDIYKQLLILFINNLRN